MAITDEQLAEWKRIANAATPGIVMGGHDAVTDGWCVATHGPYTIQALFRSVEDATLFTEAREAVLLLIAEVERLRAVLGQYADRRNWERSYDASGDLDSRLDHWMPVTCYGCEDEGWQLAERGLRGEA